MTLSVPHQCSIAPLLGLWLHTSHPGLSEPTGAQHSHLDGGEELGLEDVPGLELGAGLATEQELFLHQCQQDVAHNLTQVHAAD